MIDRMDGGKEPREYMLLACLDDDIFKADLQDHYIIIIIIFIIYQRVSYLPNPSARAGYDTRSIFKRSLTGLNSEFSFS